jgi:hypothetical protein
MGTKLFTRQVVKTLICRSADLRGNGCIRSSKGRSVGREVSAQRDHDDHDERNAR